MSITNVELKICLERLDKIISSPLKEDEYYYDRILEIVTYWDKSKEFIFENLPTED